jgi:hypothetical protein
VAEGVEGIPGLKQGRDACDVAYHGHGKSLGDAFALGLAIAAEAIRNQARQEVLEEMAAEFDRKAKEMANEASEFRDNNYAGQSNAYSRAAAICREKVATLDPSGEENTHAR